MRLLASSFSPLNGVLNSPLYLHPKQRHHYYIQHYNVMRLPTIIVTLLTAASAISSAAAAGISKDVDALSQTTSLRGAGSDAKIHQALLSAIEADELGEFDVAGLALVRMSCTRNKHKRRIEIYTLLTFLSDRRTLCFFHWSRSLRSMIES